MLGPIHTTHFKFLSVSWLCPMLIVRYYLLVLYVIQFNYHLEVYRKTEIRVKRFHLFSTSIHFNIFEYNYNKS